MHEAIQVNAIAKRSERLNSKSIYNEIVSSNKSDSKSFVDSNTLPSSSSDCSVSSASNSLRPTSEVINIMVRIKNINETHHSLAIELLTTKASLLSPCWILEDVCTVDGGKLYLFLGNKLGKIFNMNQNF